MAYELQNFVDGMTLEASHLQKLEQGIIDNANAIQNLSGVENSFKGKVISILGDSISTFEGWIPVADGHNLTHRKRYPQSNLLTDVKLTWWHRLITNLDAKLGINDSWAGSRVHNGQSSNSGDFGPDACMASITRITNLGANGTPDLIFFYGGTNDLGGSVSLGSFDSTATHTSVDLTSTTWSTFADAYKTCIMRMQYFYPDTKIIALMPMWTTSYYTVGNMDKYGEVVKSICDYFGVPVIDLRACGINWQNKGYTLGDGIHPTAQGMDLMERYIRRQLFSFYEGDFTESIVYSVTNNLTNATNQDRYIKGVSYGKPYSATLAGDLSMICVRMNGEDVTAKVLDASTGIIEIESVIGDIVIDESGSGERCTLTYTCVDSQGEKIAEDITKQVLIGATKTFTINEAPVVPGYAVQSVSPSNSQVIEDDMTIVFTYVRSEMTWYIDHTNQGDALTMSVNKAGRGWCHVPGTDAYDAIVNKPINTIAFFTNQPSQEVTIGKIVEKGEESVLHIIDTVTATISSTSKQLCTITIPETTLVQGECLVLFCQEDDNIQFYYTTGNLTDSNGLQAGDFYGRVPKVYGSGNAWQAMGTGYSLGWSIGYRSVEE